MSEIPKPSDWFPESPNHRDDLRDASNPELSLDEAVRTRQATDVIDDNPELPIMPYLDKISEAVESNPFTIIRGATGSGKSTQVCQRLGIDDEFDEVIVTQPRRLTVRTLAGRVRNEVVDKYGEEYADLVGHKMRGDKSDTPDAVINFVTNGYQEVIELSRRNREPGKKRVVIIDEAHDTSIANEVLFALMREAARRDPDLRVVVMSATVDVEKKAKFLGGDEYAVPIIDVPGRQHELEVHEGGETFSTIKKLARAGSKGLVFVSGVPEINLVIDTLREQGVTTKILPLHGQLDKSVQDEVMKNYPEGLVIVSTNIAQTGVTIPGLDWVVDTGEEKRKEVVNGVEGIRIRPTSRSSCMQRAGRAGREGKGEYHLTRFQGRRFVPLAEREEVDTPEIMRVHLDGLVLQLARNGYDIETLKFENQPRVESIRAAKQKLVALGALDEHNQITDIGRDLEKMSVDAKYGRMMIEARKYSAEVQKQLALAIAVQEVGGIIINRSQRRWQGLLDETMPADSDMLKELEVYLKAQSMNRNERKEHDLLVRNMGLVHNVLTDISRAEGLDWRDISLPTLEEREQLVKCIIAGMADSLYRREGRGEYVGKSGETRQIAKETLVSWADIVVGEPFDIEWSKTIGYGDNQQTFSKVTKIIRNITSIPGIETLREVAPQLFSEKRTMFVELPDGKIGEELAQYFNGQDTGVKEQRVAPHSDERREFIIRAATNRILWTENNYSKIIREIDRLQRKTAELLPVFSTHDITCMLQVALPDSVDTIEGALLYLPEISIDDVIPAEARQQIEAQMPDEHRGIALVYREGRPFVDSSVLPSILHDAFGDEGTLPSGAQVFVGASLYNYQSAKDIIENYKKQQVIEAAAKEKTRLDLEGAQAGLPRNIEIWRRVGGATNCGNGWVVKADGTLREFDSVPVDRYGRSANPDGTLRLEQVRPGEIVLAWSKPDVISSHRFEVVYAPNEGPTPEQIAKAAELQAAIGEDWSAYDSRKNDPRGDRSSPPVGRGWGLDAGYGERARQQHQLKQRIDDVDRKLGEVDQADLPVGMQKRLSTLLNTVWDLSQEDSYQHHEYPNKVKSLEALANKLLQDIERRKQEVSSGVVSQESLEALKAWFNN